MSTASENTNLSIEILETGDIRKLSAGPIMINQVVNSYLEPMTSNVYLRVKDGDTYQVYPLLGRYAQHFATENENFVAYKGNVHDISYEATITLAANMWFVDVSVMSDNALEMDIIYSQDIGLATEGHITNNEAYNSHYIDHKTFQTEQGYVLCSRQNQSQPGGHPFLQQGGLNGTKIVAFSVDGFPFYGLDYKFDNTIGDLHKPMLNNRLLQYEFAYAALQSQAVRLVPGSEACFTFYGAFLPNLAGRITEPIPHGDIAMHHKRRDASIPLRKPFAFAQDAPFGVSDVYASVALSMDEINIRYPHRRHEEFSDGQLLSFFTPTGEHVVLMEKERLVDRPHGHIIINLADIPHAVMTSTNYIYGVLDSQIAVGNTTFNTLNRHVRCGLNVTKASGRRLMVKIDGLYKTLSMPAVYEMGFNYARWLYKLGDDVITVTSCIGVNSPLLKLVVSSEKGRAYDFLLYDTLTPGVAVRQQNNNAIQVTHATDTMPARAYPELMFELTLDRDYSLTDDSRFYPEEGTRNNEPLLVLEIPKSDGFILKTYGFIDAAAKAEYAGCDFNIDKEVAEYRRQLSAGMLNFSLSLHNSKISGQVEKYNELALWYSHNARVHYASPHGLEQCNGAAWGLRDVCQGPFEYFLTTQNYEVCKHILRTVYAQQYIETGNWPQWFMFDEYRNIQHHESHGDIIVWPLKALCAYLDTTEDYAFLEEMLPYTHVQGYGVTTETETLLAHVRRQVNAIVADFIHTGTEATSLSCYGGGDWDDTLQPARRELAQNMVSGWTVALTYQVFREFACTIKTCHADYAQEIQCLAEDIRRDYHKHLVKDGVATGFLLFDEAAGPQYLLHPSDNKTGINYRLLPMIRGMISEIFTPEQAAAHYELIREHLYHPDGVRLMNTTPTYHGGENYYFMRAETSASFSREVSLHYIHAHIRFIEAMAKLGKGDEVWAGLNKVNPILLTETVPNAALRQSNVYFTSSDAAFDNRYDAMAHFGKVKTGDISVKSGWRLYSSGPGIYLHQLISRLLGLRIRGQNIVLDPVLPVELDGLAFSYRILDKAVTIIYRISENRGVREVKIDGSSVPFTVSKEAFRTGGAVFPTSSIKDGSTIEVHI